MDLTEFRSSTLIGIGLGVLAETGGAGECVRWPAAVMSQQHRAALHVRSGFVARPFLLAAFLKLLVPRGA